MDLNGKNVWITGASSGIGEALAKRFSREGANLVLSARRGAELRRVANLCDGRGRHHVQVLDLGVPSDWEEVAAAVERSVGNIDMLVNNAGVSQRSTGLETEEHVERKVMEVNYFGTIALTKAMLRLMLPRRAGTILTIASVSGKIGSPGLTSYCASKHALIGYLDALRAELKESGIWLPVVCPGYVRTSLSVNALTADGSSFGTTNEHIENGMAMEPFVDRLRKILDSGTDEAVIAKGRSRVGYLLHRLSPNLYHRVIRSIET